MMKRILLPFLVILIAAAIAILAWPQRQQSANPEIMVVPQPQGDFALARPGIELRFPQDFGAHEDYQTEWWYYTGNLETTAGRRFGYQLTFFRRALVSPGQRVERESDWVADQVYLAHFTITDVEANNFSVFERLSRGAAGLAGATVEPQYRVWLEDWEVKQTGERSYSLSASANGIGISLDMLDEKGPVLQGVEGYSQKGPDPGNASFYYSQTRLVSSGEIVVGADRFQVQGLSWKDHEYSTSALSQGQTGWNWFSIQLDDGIEIMVFTILREDGMPDPFSSGTIVYADGRTRKLGQLDFQVTNQRVWRSPHSGAAYPSGWIVDIPSERVTLELSPYIRDQEVNVSFTYWEGAVRVDGTRAGQKVSGSGYVELTGYAGTMAGQF